MATTLKNILHYPRIIKKLGVYKAVGFIMVFLLCRQGAKAFAFRLNRAVACTDKSFSATLSPPFSIRLLRNKSPQLERRFIEKKHDDFDQSTFTSGDSTGSYKLPSCREQIFNCTPISYIQLLCVIIKTISLSMRVF